MNTWPKAEVFEPDDMVVVVRNLGFVVIVRVEMTMDNRGRMGGISLVDVLGRQRQGERQARRDREGGD